MRIQEKGVFQSISLKEEAKKLKTRSLWPVLAKAFSLRQNRADPEVVCVACKERRIFLAHLLRLEDQDRLERFGSFSLENGFFERYVESINFENTLVLGVFFDGSLRASAELRSFCQHWGKEAELAIIVERPWHGLGLSTLLVWSALSRAKELGIRELFIHSKLEKGGAANLLRLLGKELGHGTSLGLLSVDLYASRDKEGGAAGGFIRLKLDGRLSSFQHSPQQNSAS